MLGSAGAWLFPRAAVVGRAARLLPLAGWGAGGAGAAGAFAPLLTLLLEPFFAPFLRVLWQNFEQNRQRPI